jgi:hypothetical protein
MLSVGKGLGGEGKNVVRQHFGTPHSSLAPRLQTSIKFQYNHLGNNLVFFIIMVKVKKVT